MKRLIWLPIAGFLLVAGAAVAAAAPGMLDSTTSPVVAATPAPSTDPGASPTTAGPTTDGPHGFADNLLQSVLADLVTKGTITQAQSDAITQGIQDQIAQDQADAQARQALIQKIVADGVITMDEIDQLPADDPLRVAFDSIASNGQVTLDQLRGLGPFGGPGGPGGFDTHGRGPGGWWGHGPDDDGANPGTNPQPSSSPS